MVENTSFYSQDELSQIGFSLCGDNVQISRYARIYGASNIKIGNSVRIDDFCILSGNIDIGNHVHIAAYDALFGGSAGIQIHDYCGISSRSAIYAASDDYSGEHMTNPTIDIKYRSVTEKKVILQKHVLIGTMTTILPGVVIGEGTAVGSMSLVNRSLDPWGIYVGVPCRYLKNRSRNLLDLEHKLMTDASKE